METDEAPAHYYINEAFTDGLLRCQGILLLFVSLVMDEL